MSIHVFAETDATRSRRDATQENGARTATCVISITTTGNGHMVLPAPMPFDCSFLALPVVGTGQTWEIPPPSKGGTAPIIMAATGDDSDTTPGTAVAGYTIVPTAHAGVYGYQRDGKGLYVGAYFYFTVAGDDNTVIHHDITFTGPALKKLDPTLTTRLTTS
jgi:hypothetical protein